MGSLSPVHWVIVLVIVLLLFGPGRLAGVGKGLGEGIRSFKKGLNELEIKIVGTNSNATPASAQSDLFQVGLDRLELQP